MGSLKGELLGRNLTLGPNRMPNLMKMGWAKTSYGGGGAMPPVEASFDIIRSLSLGEGVLAGGLTNPPGEGHAIALQWGAF